MTVNLGSARPSVVSTASRQTTSTRALSRKTCYSRKSLQHQHLLRHVNRSRLLDHCGIVRSCLTHIRSSKSTMEVQDCIISAEYIIIDDNIIQGDLRTSALREPPEPLSILRKMSRNIDTSEGDNEAVEASTLKKTSLQLASVKLLLSSERDATIHDLLLATAFEYLDSGARTSQEIATHLEAVWPGFQHSLHTVETTLREAERTNYVTTQRHQGSRTKWEIAERGRLDLSGSRKWANDVIDRAEEQIRRAAIDYFGSSDLQEIQRWTGILIESISVSLSKGFAVDPSRIDLIDNLLIPAELSIDLVDQRLNQLVRDQEVRDFLRSIARTSLDPSSTFGSELVHHLTLGYALHAFAAGFDNPDARKAIGSLKSEVFILDTPILLGLAGPRTQAESILSILSQARKSGVRVITMQRTIDELNKALATRNAEAQAIEESLQRREIEVQHLRVSISDQVLQMWLSSEPEGLADWLTWEEFCAKCQRTIGTVKAHGGKIALTEHRNHDDSQSKFENALKQRLSERGGGRGDWQIGHDAEMLVNLQAFRLKNPANQTKIWPGAIIVSPDTYLSDSYRTGPASKTHEFPATITVGQWAAILAKCSDPVTAELLAEALSREVSARALLSRAVTVPLETAVQIARSLRNTPVSEVALGAMNISVEDILMSESVDDRESTVTAQELAVRVLAQRHAQLERVAQEQRNAAGLERQEAEKHRVRLETRTEERERAHRREAARERERSSKLETEKSKLQDQITKERAAARTDNRRVFVSTLVCLTVLGSAIILFVSKEISTRGLIVALAGTTILIGLSIDWYRNTRGWYEIAIPTLVNGGWLGLDSLLQD